MRRNVASQVIGAQMVSATDGSAFTGSVTCSVTINGGSQATGTVGSGACTHEGNGYHTYTPSQAETNGQLVAFTFTGSGAVPATVQVFTTGYDYGSANLPANVTQFGGSNGTFASGRPEVNTTHAAGTAWGSGAITAGALASDAITAAKVASDVGTEIATAVWANGTRVLTAGTNIALAKGTGVTGFNDLSAAQVNAEVDSAIETYHLDHLLAATYDPASKPGAADALLNELVENDGGVSRFTANALEEAPTGGGGSAPTADEVADAVWDEAQSGHVSAGTFGELATEIAAILADTGTDGVVVASGSKTGYRLSSSGVDDVLDEVVEGSFTLRQMIRLVAAALVGELSGAATTTITIRDASDTKTRITATVDSDGNRSALTLDAT